ncbi:MAG: CHC2 zinc finger domain-containing protein [Janthinobacterium lividum]
MNDALDAAVLLPPDTDKPSKQYRTSPYTVQEFMGLPYNTRRAVDATCNEQEGISFTTYDDEASDKPFTVGRRPNTTPMRPTSSATAARPATPHTPHILAPTPDMLLTAIAPAAPLAHAETLNNENTSTVAALVASYSIAAVAGQYVNLIPYEENADWTHHSYSPFTGGSESSFAVNDRTGAYKCFDTDREGTALDLVLFMEEEEVSDEKEALAWLAARFTPSDTTHESLEIAPVAEGADGPACSYPGHPTSFEAEVSDHKEEETTEVVHENGPLPADAEFAELTQATSEVNTLTEHAPPTAIVGTVYMTTDYEMFQRTHKNRVINPGHVAKLVREISRKNMLHIRPIDVTADLLIIDGQHRREAARELGVPLYYRISNLTTADIKNLNVANKNWTGLDYLHHYKELGKPDYQALAVFMESHPILSFSNAVMLLQDTEENRAQEFNDGDWTASQSLDMASQTADFIKRIGVEVPSFKQSKNSRFISAVLHCMKSLPGFDTERFLRKVLLDPLKLVPCGTRQQYLTLFQHIYNYNMSKDKHLNFL